MKLLLAPNAFKESLSQREAARALERGIRRALPDARIVLAPMADGGDGFFDTLILGAGGRRAHATVDDPLGRPVHANYGILPEGAPKPGRHSAAPTAVIEMAAASGLRLLSQAERNPMRTSTRGTGQLICAAVARGARRLLIGVGGSATTDGGSGMAEALGYRFLDARGRPVKPCGGALTRIAAIDAAGYERWRRSLGDQAPIECILATDVTNPLLGRDGAARVFAPQKGATPSEVERLEEGMEQFARVVRRDLGVSIARLKGGGAGGGLAAGLVAFLGAAIHSGADVVAETIGLARKMEGADWVITGEGCLDRQTAFGKAPALVAQMACERGIPVIGVCGKIGEGASRLHRQGFTAIFSLCDGPMPLEEAMQNAGRLLERLGFSIATLIRGSHH